MHMATDVRLKYRLNLHSNLSQNGIELSYNYTKDSSQNTIGEIKEIKED